MKNKYPGFYSISDESLSEIWTSDSTLFVFDTNCLLNLYRCEEHTREDILNVMSNISNRSWVPFQVGLEFQKNRRSVINSSIESLESIKEALNTIHTQNILEHGKVKRALYTTLSEKISNLQNSIKEPIDSFIENEILPRIKTKKEISIHDHIRDSIDSIVGDRVGDLPTQEYIDQINKEGELRYSNKIPPGFKDAAKKDISHHSGITFQDKFGDLYLWKELLKKASDEKIKNVILISDDAKEDWLFIYKNTTHGPLESLKTEICQQANVENFSLINQFTFLNDAKKYLENISVSEESLEEIENLSSLDYEHVHITQPYPSKQIRQQLMKDYWYKHFTSSQAKNIKESNRERIISQAHEQLDIFDDLTNNVLYTLDKLTAENCNPEGLINSSDNMQLFTHLYELLESTKFIAQDLSEAIMEHEDVDKITDLTSQLRIKCRHLEYEKESVVSFLS